MSDNEALIVLMETIDRKIDSLHEDLRTHVSKDEAMYGRVERHDTELRITKWLGGSAAASALAYFGFKL